MAQKYRLEIFSRDGTPLCELHDVLGVRWAYDRQLVFELPQSHPKAIEENLRHFNLVRLTHETLEPWTGYILDPSWGTSQELISVTCNPTKTLLGKGETGVMKFVDKLPGEVFAYLINQANLDEHTGIYVSTMYMGQKPISIEMRGENCYDKIQELCDKADLDWYLEYVNITTHIAHLRERQGRDLTASVVILGGYDTEGVPEFRPEVTNFANDIKGVGKLPEGFSVPEGEDDYKYRPTVRKVDPYSIRFYGRWKAVVEFSDTEDTPTLASMTEQEVERRAYPVISEAVTLNNQRSWLWSQFTDGDVIALQLPRYGFGGVAVPIRILGREVDPSRDTMTLACESVQGSKAKALDMYKYFHYMTPVSKYSVEAPDSGDPAAEPSVGGNYGTAKYGSATY